MKNLYLFSRQLLPGKPLKKRQHVLYRFCLSCLMLAGIVLPGQVSAALVTIWTGYSNSSTYSGLYAYNAFSSSESIYTAAEIGTVGKISTYALSKASGSTTVIDSVSIYMKESTVSTLTTTASLAGYTLVYKGNFPNAAASGWMTVTLDSKFSYTGTGNLHVMVVRRNATASSNYNYYHYSYNSSGIYGFGYYYNAKDPWSGSPATSTQYSSTTARIDVQFNVDAFDPCTGTPVAGTAVASKTVACAGESVRFKLTGSTLASAITYAWDTSASGSGVWALAGTSTTTPGDWSFVPPPGRTLDYRCRLTCAAGGTSVTSSTVSVAVGSIATLPYIQDFEATTAGVNVPCSEVLPRWDPATALDANSSATWRLQNGSVATSTLGWGPRSGSQYLHAGYLIGYSSNAPGYWFTPALALTPGNTYRFSYWYRVSDYIAANYASTGVDVGMYLCNNNSSTTGMVAIKPDLRIKSNIAYELNEGDFTVATPGYYFLAVKVDNNAYPYYGGTLVDDISVRQLSPCTTATAADFASGGKAASSVSTLCALPGSVDLSIGKTPGFSGLDFSWEVAKGSPAAFTPAGITTARGTYNITTGGNYYLRCKVSCASSGLFAYSDTILVKTTPITPPYFENFESGEPGVNMPCAGFTGTFTAGTTSGWDLKIAPYGTAYPGIVNHTPSGSKYLFGGYYMGMVASTVPRFWFTPGMALTAGKAYNFSFWVSNNAYSPTSYSSSSIDLGIRAGTAQTEADMTITAGDDTTITPNLATAAAYNKVERGFIAPTTGTYYVGISYNCTGSAFPGVAFDDIGLDQLPSCAAKPVAGRTKAKPALVCSTGTTVLSLSGTSMASDLKFQWQVSATNLPGSWSDVTTGTGGISPVYTTGTLSSGPWYYRCIVICPLTATPAADTSVPVKVSVGALDLPYVEDFESASAGVNMPCASQEGTWNATSLQYWSLRSGAYSTSYPGINNHTPGGKFYLYSGYYNGPYYATGDKFFWYTPALKMTSGKGYTVSFWYNGIGSSSGYNGLKIGIYAGTAQNAAGMTIRAGGVDTSIDPTVNLYRKFQRSFVAPTTGSYYVGIKTYHTGYNYPGIPIDDINISQSPDCSGKPVAGIADAMPNQICGTSGTSLLRLSGTSVASGITYQWQTATAAAGPWTNATGGTGATAGDFTTPTISASTWYRCIVSCSGSGLKDTSAALLVTVGALTPPYRETFEMATAGTNVPCAAVNGTWATPSTYQYWTVKGAPLTSSAPAIVNHTPSGNQYLFGGYSIGTYSTTTPMYWFSPGIKLDAGNTYEFSYWYSGSGYTGGSTDLGIYYGTAQTAAAMTAMVPEIKEVNNNTYKQFAGRVIPVTTGVYYMGIKVNHTVYSYYGMAIDDINLEQLPPCAGTPTAGAISVSPTMMCTSGGTAALNMDLSGVSRAAGLTYRWEWSADNFVSVAGTGPAAAAPAYTSPPLSAATYFRCIVKCAATGDSSISSVIKLNVGVIKPPYIETFETGIAGKNMPCAAWTGSWASGSGWYLYNGPYSSYATADNHTPGGSKYLMAGYSIGTYSTFGPSFWFTPAIRFDAGKLYQFSFWYNGTGYSSTSASTIGAYYGTAQTAAAMTTAIAPDLVGINTRTYQYYARQFTASATGDYYIGIRVDNGTLYNPPGIAIDDIGLQEVVACDASVTAGTVNPDPVHVCSLGDGTNLGLLGSTLATGLSYTWQSAAAESGPYTTAGTGLPYSTGPLMTNTWFRAIVTCTATGIADTSDPLLVGVGGTDLPYVEDFESTPAGQKPLCSDATTWGNYYYDGWNVYSGSYSTGYTNHTPGGKKHLIAGYYLGAATTGAYTTVTEDNYWFTPGFKLYAGYKYDLSFWYVASSGGVNWNRMGVFYGMSQSVGAMTNTIIPFQRFDNTSYAQADTTFYVNTTGIYYLGFKKSSEKSGTYSYNGVAFDDINLNYAACDGMPEAGSINGSVPSGTALCKNTVVRLSDPTTTFGLVPGIRFQWERKSLGGSLPLSWTAVEGATDTVLNSDTLTGYEYRLAVICANTHDTAFTTAFQLPENPPHPEVSITPGTSPIIFCAGDTVHLNATPFPGAVYDWMLDGVVLPGWKFSDIAVVQPGDYTLKVTSPVSLCPAYTSVLRIQEADPGYSVTITTPEDSIICDGMAVTLKAVASKAGVSYQWQKNNVRIPGANGSSYIVTEGGYYRVMVSDGFSTCAAGSRNVHFTVKPNPEAVINTPGGTLTACAEDGVILSAGSNGYSYQWTRSGSDVFGWNDSVVLVKNSGTYAVRIRSKEGCISRSKDVAVTILPAPLPVISRTGMVLSTVAGTYLSYRWERTSASGVSLEGTGPSVILSKKGLYKVIVTDVNGCKGESAPFEVMDEGLAVDDVTTGNTAIHIYPNPTTGLVHIESPVAVKVSVKDVTGRVVLEQQLTQQVDLSRFANGVYLLLISNEQGDILLQQQRVSKVSQ